MTTPTPTASTEILRFSLECQQLKEQLDQTTDLPTHFALSTKLTQVEVQLQAAIEVQRLQKNVASAALKFYYVTQDPDTCYRNISSAMREVCAAKAELRKYEAKELSPLDLALNRYKTLAEMLYSRYHEGGSTIALEQELERSTDQALEEFIRIRSETIPAGTGVDSKTLA